MVSSGIPLYLSASLKLCYLNQSRNLYCYDSVGKLFQNLTSDKFEETTEVHYEMQSHGSLGDLS
jgi:hypothetical protein